MKILRWQCPLFVAGWAAICLVPTSRSAEPPHLPSSSSFTNSLGMRLVSIPGLPVAFSIWETRVQDYEPFAKATQREMQPPDFDQGPEHPVVNVTWDEATAFCNWLTAQERQSGRISAQQRYRLPTDAEWSAAAGLGPESGKNPEERARNAIVWPWGIGWPPQPGAGNYAPELAADSFEHTSTVGCFAPNRFGLYDMGGNVWEMCEDWYNQTHVTKALRGASFHDSHPKDLLAAYRFSATVHLSNDDIGFRIVLETKKSPETTW